MDVAIELLEEATTKLLNWFTANKMKANPEKCHLLTSSNERVNINIEGVEIKSSNLVKLLGVHLDSKLTFEKHIDNVCKKTSQKISALSRIIPYMETEKAKIVMKTFIVSQFNYCPLHMDVP